jgi:hypothetical protein
LVNKKMPYFFDAVTKSTGIPHNTSFVQDPSGAALQYNWEPPHNEGPNHYTTTLPGGKVDILVLTEAVPFDGSILDSQTTHYADLFYKMAVGANPSARVYIYETWTCVFSGPNWQTAGCSSYSWDDEKHIPWRQRLTNDLPTWSSIPAALNAANDGPEVFLVPAGQAMALLSDEIEAERVPGISNITSLFSDFIHLNDSGNYFIGLVQFATIYKRTPVGLTAQIPYPLHLNSGPYQTFNGTSMITPVPAADTLRKLQEIAWRAVCDNRTVAGLSAAECSVPADRP